MFSETMKLITKYKKYYSEDLNVECLENVEKELIILESSGIETKEQLIDFINKFNEFNDIIEQRDLTYFVKFTLNTSDEVMASKRIAFNKEVVMKAEPYYFSIKNKIISNP